MKLEETWIDLDIQKPDSGEQVKLKCADGSETYAFRGFKPCSNCWYSPFGGELIIVPTHWKPIPDEDKVDTSKKIDIYDLLDNE